MTTASGKQIAGKGCNHHNASGSSSARRNARREPLVFDTVEELRAYVIPRWRERFVTTHLWDEDTFERFLILPFFFLVSVDAPISIRWRRFVDRCVSYLPEITHHYLSLLGYHQLTLTSPSQMQRPNPSHPTPIPRNLRPLERQKHLRSRNRHRSPNVLRRRPPHEPFLLPLRPPRLPRRPLPRPPRRTAPPAPLGRLLHATRQPGRSAQ